MKLPYEKFLIYLLVTKHTEREIIDLLRSFGLPHIGNIYLRKLRDDIVATSGQSSKLYDFLMEDNNVISKQHRSDLRQEWADKYDVKEFHNSEEDCMIAYQIFSNKKQRDYINLYCLCDDIRNEVIASQFSNRFDIQLTPEQVDMYKKYFFCTDDMSAMDWQKYVVSFPPRLRILYEAAPLKKSKYIQWKLGDNVDINPYYIANQLSHDFFFLSRDAHSDKKAGWEDQAVKFAEVALKASDRVAKSGQSNAKNQTLDMIKMVETQPEGFASFEDMLEDEDDDLDVDDVT